ncbi:unnamed protein product, partial [Mesorhabditis spiculigera]
MNVELLRTGARCTREALVRAVCSGMQISTWQGANYGRCGHVVDESDGLLDGIRQSHSFDETRAPMLGTDGRRPASFDCTSRAPQAEAPVRAPSFDLGRGLDLPTRLGLTLPNMLQMHPNSLSPLPPLSGMSGGLSPLHPGLSSSLTSAFSAVDVPRLMVHSPIENRSPIPGLSPSHHPSADIRLLTVPSPDPSARLLGALTVEHFRRSPDSSRSPVGDAAAEVLASMNNAMLGLNGQSFGLGMGWGTAGPQKIGLSHLSQQESGDSLGDDGSMGIDLEGLAPHIAQMAAQAQLASPELMAQMPPKSIIQEEVRNGGGRFQLVRKRGRSEVWNLFGQVLDTLTGVRLPYVACYACKVLYTDTGGGTGNMTRHRCPIGTSYRNSMPSTSSETAEGAATSSFDSMSSAQMPRKRSCTPDRKPQANNNEGASSPLPSSNRQPSLHSGHPSPGAVGDVEKELLAETAARAAAIDLRPTQHFTSAGFRQMCGRLLLLGRRYGQCSPSDILPDEAMIQNSRDNLLRFSLEEIRSELRGVGVEVTLSVEKLEYKGIWNVVWASRLTRNWNLKHLIIGVYPSSVTECDAIRLALKHLNLTLDPEHTRTLGLPQTFENFENIPDIGAVLEQVVSSTLSPDHRALLDRLADLRRRVVQVGAQMPHKFPQKIALTGVRGWYEECHTWRLHHEALQVLLSKHSGLQAEVAGLPWSSVGDVDAFLEPFHESLTALANEMQPTLNLVIPEWSALVHECRVEEDDDRLAPGLRAMKQQASQRLEEAASSLQPVHRMAAILNPRLARSLAILFTDQQRSETCRQIRDLCGIAPRSGDRPSSGSSIDADEPSRKRRLFLSQLESGGSTDDELECYSRSQFPTQQTREVLTFWSTAGSSQFPALAGLARRLYSMPAVPLRSYIPPSACISAPELATTLILRRAFENETDD